MLKRSRHREQPQRSSLLSEGAATAAIANPSSQMIAVQKGIPVKILIILRSAATSSGLGFRKAAFQLTFGPQREVYRRDQIFASGGTIYAKGLLSEAGLSERDYTLVEVGVGARAAAALKSNQVQALSMYDEAYAQLEQAGLEDGADHPRSARKELSVPRSIVVQNLGVSKTPGDVDRIGARDRKRADLPGDKPRSRRANSLEGLPSYCAAWRRHR